LLIVFAFAGDSTTSTFMGRKALTLSDSNDAGNGSGGTTPDPPRPS
jgi:hypothetical protein